VVRNSRHGAWRAAGNRPRRKALRRFGRLPPRGRYFIIVSHRKILGPDQTAKARLDFCQMASQFALGGSRLAGCCARFCAQGRSRETVTSEKVLAWTVFRGRSLDPTCEM